MLTVIFDLQDVESMSTTSVTRGNINRPSCITTSELFDDSDTCKWIRLMLCPLRNTFRKTHESLRKPIKTTSLKSGDGITLMRDYNVTHI
jgi:hypothetical protein